MKAEDIHVHGVYRGKRRGVSDRFVMFISSDRSVVQYDSDAVRIGQHFPSVSMDKFLRWAKEEISQ